MNRMSGVTGVLLLGVLVAAAGAVGAQTGARARFSDPERLVAVMDSTPERVMRVLESVLSPEQVGAVEAALFPEGGAWDKTRALERARKELVRAGFEEQSDVVAAVDAGLAGLREAAEADGGGDERELHGVSVRNGL